MLAEHSEDLTELNDYQFSQQREKEGDERCIDYKEKDEKQQEIERHLKLIIEQRYKGLVHLMKRSQFFANSLLNTENNNRLGKRNYASKNKNKDISETMSATEQGFKKRKLNSHDIVQLLPQSTHEEDMDAGSLNTSKNFDILKVNYKDSIFFKGELYDFQKVGVQWLIQLQKNGLNGILADEMGLGKTIQVIALISHIMQNKISGHHFVVAPLSTLANWVLEFQKFAPELKVILYNGNERKDLWNKINRKYTLSNGFKTFPIIITNYEMVISNSKLFSTLKYNYIVIDEGHRIKNHEAVLRNTLEKFQSVNRLLLTGTPLQNNLVELWSLLNFLMPDVFNNLDIFVSWFDLKDLQSTHGRAQIMKLEEEKNVIGLLREILQPIMLRRVKDEVGLKIPLKKEVIVYCPMTEIQNELYRAVLNRDIKRLSMIDEELLIDIGEKRLMRKCRLAKESPELLRLRTEETPNANKLKYFTNVTERNINYLIKLTPNSKITNYKKIVNHPYLVHQPLNGYAPVDDEIIKQSGKLMVLDKMLEKLHARGHKVLLFSTWIQILDIVEDYLSMKSYEYCRLDGSVNVQNRIDNIETFNTDPNVFIFLITTRAGGIGLNLMAADTVIIYDSDWNPQMDIQAISRCHRIGQVRPVMIYRFVTKGTIDEEIIRRGEAKMKLEKAVIEKRSPFTCNLSGTQHLMRILEETNNNIVQMDEEAITNEELEKILDRTELTSMMEENSMTSSKI